VKSSADPNPGETDLLLVNPSAGGGRAGAILPNLREFALRQCWNLEICVTQSAADLVAKALQAAGRCQKRIFVLGGDGTFQLLVNSVACHPQVIVGVIPAGAGNDLAAALGLPADPLRAAALLLEGEVCEVDVVRVRTSDGKQCLYTGGGGVGLDAEAVRHANGTFRNLPGRSRYLFAAMRALLAFQPLRARITIAANESNTFEAMTLLVAVLNTPSYGGGVYLAPEARVDDGNLEVVLLEKLSILEILTLLPSFALRGKLKTPWLRRFSARQVRIETEPPSLFHGDGEFVGLTPVEISVVPKAVRVLRAARKAT
jgi:diacylglycerol kinase (ATP)